MTRRVLARQLTLSLALLLFAGAASARVWPAAVMAYLGELQRVENSGGDTPMEPLFEAAQATTDALMRFDGELAWIETLSDGDYTALAHSLRGMRLSRGLDVYAQPDAAFLDALAVHSGTAADRAFFALYVRSWKEDGLPTYLRQKADRIAPCVRFSEGVIPDLYSDWRVFHLEHPQSYAAYARQWIADLEELVELGTCACGDQNSVEYELSGFLTRFPESPVRNSVLARLQQLEDDPAIRPVNCR